MSCHPERCPSDDIQCLCNLISRALVQNILGRLVAGVCCSFTYSAQWLNFGLLNQGLGMICCFSEEEQKKGELTKCLSVRTPEIWNNAQMSGGGRRSEALEMAWTSCQATMIRMKAMTSKQTMHRSTEEAKELRTIYDNHHDYESKTMKS